MVVGGPFCLCGVEMKTKSEYEFPWFLKVMKGMHEMREKALNSGTVIYDDGDSVVVIPHKKIVCYDLESKE